MRKTANQRFRNRRSRDERDPGKWAGLSQLDCLIALNPKTGKPANLLAAVDEVARMVAEVDGLTGLHMQNVPESVRDALMLLGMATGTLAMILRARVVTEAIPLPEEPR